MAFVRHGQDPLRQGRVLGFVRSDVAEEGTDRGQSGVARTRVVAALVLEMAQEGAEEVGVQVAELQFRRGLLQHLAGMADQQSERVPVAGDGVRAGLELLHEAVGEERRQESGEVGGHHDGDLLATRSSRRAASCISSGVTVRYQAGVAHVRMAEVGRQTGQMALDVDAAAVPAEQRPDSKSMAQVMQTGTAGIGRAAQADLPGQLDERPAQGQSVIRAPCSERKKLRLRGLRQRRYKIFNFIGVTVCNSIPREIHRGPARVPPSVPWSL